MVAPLARDSSYYTIGLIALAMFFLFGKKSADGKNQIEWFESVILLCLYVGYVVLMKFHLKVQICLVRHCHPSRRKKKSQKSGSKSPTSVSPTRRNGELVRQQSSRSALIVKLQEQDEAKLTSPMNFRAGVLHLIVSKRPLVETAGLHIVTRSSSGDVRETFKQISGQEAPEGKITRENLRQLLLDAGFDEDVGNEEIDKAFDKLDKNSDGHLNWMEFSLWYKSSEAKIWADSERVFGMIDKNGDGRISRNELIDFEQVLGRAPDQEEIDNAWLSS